MNQDLLTPPSLISVSGVTSALLGSLFGAAADFYRLAPWKFFQREIPLTIWYPPESESRIAVILGAAGDSFGLSVHGSRADIQQIMGAKTPLEGAAQTNWLALSYDTSMYLAQEDLQAIHWHGWAVADEKAYPSIVRMGAPGPDLFPPTLNDLYWLEGTLLGLLTFFLPPYWPAGQDCLTISDHKFPILTHAGQAAIRIRFPSPIVDLTTGG